MGAGGAGTEAPSVCHCIVCGLGTWLIVLSVPCVLCSLCSVQPPPPPPHLPSIPSFHLLLFLPSPPLPPLTPLLLFHPQVCCLKGQKKSLAPPTYDGIHIINHYEGDDGSYQSSDEDTVGGPGLGGPSLGGPSLGGQRGDRIRLHPNLGVDSDSEEEDDEALRLTVPPPSSSKSTTV